MEFSGSTRKKVQPRQAPLTTSETSAVHVLPHYITETRASYKCGIRVVFRVVLGGMSMWRQWYVMKRQEGGRSHVNVETLP